LVLALPLFHMHGLGVGLHGTLLSGASVVLQPRFDADAVSTHALISRRRCSSGCRRYTRVGIVVASGRAVWASPLRVGSAPLAADLHGRMVRRGCSRARALRMTETLMNVSNPYDGERRAGTVGFPLPGVRGAPRRERERCRR